MKYYIGFDIGRKHRCRSFGVELQYPSKASFKTNALRGASPSVTLLPLCAVGFEKGRVSITVMSPVSVPPAGDLFGSAWWTMPKI